MRVLVSSISALGHVHPMVPLARALVDRGHEVRWAIAEDLAPRVSSAGFDVAVVGMTEAARWAEYERRFPESAALAPQDLPAFMFPRLFGDVLAPAMLADLLPVAERWRPDLVLHDTAELAAPIVAAVLDVPTANHGFGCLLPRERVASAEPWVAPLWEAHGLPMPAYGGCYDGLYLDIYPPSLSPSAHDHVPRVQSLRPVAFDAAGSDVVPSWLRDVRDSAHPIVYVTFGTVFNRTPAFVDAIQGVAPLDVDVVVTVGPNGDPDALGRVPSNVRVERYVPQTALLPRCAAVVSHAGSGTFLGCLGNGVPQLCLPQAADQFLNAAGGASSGAAISLLPGSVSVDAVGDAVSRLLSEPSFGGAASRLRDELAGMPSPDEVAGVLESFAASA